MCGISGILPLSNSFDRNDLSLFSLKMRESLHHRGPDASGCWIDPLERVVLSHNRLSIIDLSSAGSQPMVSRDGRLVLTFNGEIYNHRSLRRELEEALCNHDWRGTSDTETLLAAIGLWGLEKSLQKCYGMFSLALWDSSVGKLYLARDRFGEKPLYWGITGADRYKALVFASELSALRAYQGFDSSIDRNVLAHFLRFGAISAPNSIYSGISQLLPGHLISISHGFTELPEACPWWSFQSHISSCLDDPYIDESIALQDLESALVESVRDQSVSDVPIGAFLSGGVDSSLIAALMQAHSSRPIRTFTIGFDEADFNEAPFARSVAAHLGTDHSETVVTAADAMQLIPSLAKFYSEPFADSSQLPTHLVCREARRSGLTVALTGDGGDELFCGYNRYFWGPKIWDRLSWLPWSLRRIIGLCIRVLPPPFWDFFGGPLSIYQFGQKAHKLADRLSYVRSSDDLYHSLVSEWRDPATLLQVPLDSEINESPSPLSWPLPDALSKDPVSRMMAIDTLNYLPNDILTKVDRAAMATSLETRAPFLDPRVAAVAWRMPMHMKIHPGQGALTSKWALRQLLYKYVPPELIERPKAGFGIPIGHWLRGPLREWASDLLEPTQIKRQGYLRPEPIQKLWCQHLSGRFDHTTRLWAVLMWQAWLAEWG